MLTLKLSRLRVDLRNGSHLPDYGGCHENRISGHGAFWCSGTCHRHLHWLRTSSQLYASLVLLDSLDQPAVLRSKLYLYPC